MTRAIRSLVPCAGIRSRSDQFVTSGSPLRLSYRAQSVTSYALRAYSRALLRVLADLSFRFTECRPQWLAVDVRPGHADALT
jgi:hypothetical protein